MDLHHLAGKLLARWPMHAFEIQQVIDGQGIRSPITTAGHVGLRMTPARGRSIYLGIPRPVNSLPGARLREADRLEEFQEAYLRLGRA